MSKQDDRWLFLTALSHLISESEKLGIKFCVYTFHRSAEEQARKLAEGRSQVRYSQHQDWLAVDIFVLRNGEAVWKHVPGDEYSTLGEIWEQYNSRCRWGGRWKTLVDATHFEVCRA